MPNTDFDTVQDGTAAKVVEADPQQRMQGTLDEIARSLHRMDRRDRLRTYGAMVHTVLAFLPTIFFLWSAWYVYAHGTELLKMVAGETAKQAAQYSDQKMDSFMDSLTNAANSLTGGGSADDFPVTEKKAKPK